MDKEIIDKSCVLCFPATVDSAHTAWIKKNKEGSYISGNLYERYPSICLGYTYDWCPCNPGHRGVSEFIAKQNSRIYIRRIRSTLDYFKP